MDYKQILTNVVTSTGASIEHGRTILCIWKNEAHLEEWNRMQNAPSSSVRIASAPSSFFPMLVDAYENYNDVCIIALVFGVAYDYSDTRCLFHMGVERITASAKK